MGDIWTIGRVLKWTEEHFTERGTRTPRLDAEIIISYALKLDRVALYTKSDKPLVTEEREEIKKLIKRRLSGEPVAYIVGVKEFWGLSLQVTPDVLVPRPETEEIIEEAWTLFQTKRREPLRFADVGTGSGCIAAALLAEFPQATCVAVDISEAALNVAKSNFSALGFSERVTTRAGNLLDALAPDDPPFDIIASNPPYVPVGEIETLAPEVRFESRIALDGGIDGLDLVRKLVEDAPRYLKPDGWLLMEIGSGQDEEVAAIKTADDFVFSGFRRDLAGINRVAKWRRITQ